LWLFDHGQSRSSAVATGSGSREGLKRYGHALTLLSAEFSFFICRNKIHSIGTTFQVWILSVVPGKFLINPSGTPLYHCMSRCVRRAFLCGDEGAHRKQWIEDRMREFAEWFAVDVSAFSIMDNHLRLLLRLDLPRAIVVFG